MVCHIMRFIKAIKEHIDEAAAAASVKEFQASSLESRDDSGGRSTGADVGCAVALTGGKASAPKLPAWLALARRTFCDTCQLRKQLPPARLHTVASVFRLHHNRVGGERSGGNNTHEVTA